MAGKTFTLKLKYSDFKLQTRSKTGTLYLSSKEMVFEQAKALLYQTKIENSVRLIGISISNLNTIKAKTLTLKKIEKNLQLSLPF